MFCKNCGNQLNENQIFCEICGVQKEDNVKSKIVTGNLFIFSIVRCIIELISLILSIFLMTKIDSFYVIFINSIIYIIMASIPNLIIKIEKKAYIIANLMSIFLYSIMSVFGYIIYLNIINANEYERATIIVLFLFNCIIIPFYFCVNLILDKIIKK